ncbi:hypothetical protein OB919_20030 [Halobacteria archaeon AArc-curdl1]|uniref:Uncharacterized protein n=1 Tax=Natronosalvus hydrolyticus TaxID=2979988 RepID=A0AAP3E8S6_9EURY|nr:hypothetical protein [Halobacteria archaeon AArc-curdl1]
MNIYTQTNSAVRRAHKALARDLDVYNFVFDPDAGENEYADGDWIERVGYPQTVSATIRSKSQPDDASGPDGADVAVDVTIYVDPNEIEVDLGQNNETRATEFVDSASGRRFRAVDVHHQESLLEIYCEVL